MNIIEGKDGSKQRTTDAFCFISRKDTGKTTDAKTMADRSTKRVLFVDVLDHSSYRHIPFVHPTRLGEWNEKCTKGHYRIFHDEIEKILEFIFYTMWDTTIIIEDGLSIFDDSLPKRLRRGFIQCRNRGVDIVVMFHCFQDVPSFIAKQTNYFMVGITEDDLSLQYKKFGSVWPRLRDAQPNIRKLINSGKKPRWYKEVIKRYA